MEYRWFETPRRAEEYIGQAGRYTGFALPGYVYEAIAEAKTRHLPSPYLVIGEWVREDGARWVDCAISKGYIESVTNYRADERGILRWTCPSCGRFGGKHTKVCEYEL